MFRNSGENPSDNIASIFGLNGLNSLGLQDMYLDTSTLNTAETLSTASISPPAPMSVGSKIDFTALQEQQQQQLNATLLGNAMNGGTLSDMATILFQQQQAQQLRVLQQQKLQQQQHQLAQQQQLVQQQLALANAVNANHYHHQQHQQQQQQDEICHSLKMFAMLSAYSESQSGQHDIMQDFASNGYTSDNLYYNKNQLAPNQNQSFLAATAQSQQQLLQQLQAQTWVNQNYSDLRNNADNQWRNSTTTSSYMPSSLKMSTTTITAGATMAIGNDVSNNKLPEQNAPNKTIAASKSQKRHNALNKEKYASSKHCVFCENNNEPEAVIKSHSVRDSQGRVLCPKLRTYVCPICKASGDLAHTVKYCPKKPVITMEDAIKAESFRLAKSAYYKQQMKV